MMADDRPLPGAPAAWTHFAHGADIGVRGIGMTAAAAFAEAARALFAVITDLDTITPRVGIAIACEAPDLRILLIDWLNALIYESATRKMLFSRFEVEIEGSRLTGRAWGEAVDVARHAPAVEPKGATFTALRVERTADGQWLAQCVVDV